MKNQEIIFEFANVIEVDKSSGLVLFSVFPDEDVFITDETKLGIIWDDDSLVPITVSPSTFIFPAHFKKDSAIYIIALINGNECSASAIVEDKVFLKQPSGTSLLDKISNIGSYLQLPSSIRDNIDLQLKEPLYLSNSYAGLHRDLAELRTVFEICKYHYSPEIRKEASDIFKKLEQHSVSSNERGSCLERLRGLLVCTGAKKTPAKTYDELMSILDTYILGMHNVKRQIVEQILLMQRSNTAPLRMLLVGPPGVGKTSIIKAVSKCIGDKKIEVCDCPGASEVSLKGCAPTYDKASFSKIGAAFARNGTTNILLVLEELDKTPFSDNFNGFDAFIDILEPEHTRFFDEFIGVSLDTKNTSIAATANTTCGIPEYVLSRFPVKIHLSGYSYSEKAEIAENFTLPKLLRRYNISPNWITITEPAFERMAKYTKDEGAREINAILMHILRKANAFWSQSRVPIHVTISEATVEEYMTDYCDDYHHERKIGYI